MSDRARWFVERHRLGLVNATKGVVLTILANNADDGGKAKMTQRDVEARMTKSLITVKRAFGSLQQDGGGGPFLAKAKGRGWIILGVADHDGLTCGDEDCRAVASIPDDETPEQRRRRKTLDRVRRHRERKRVEARRAAETA
jgi:hypothetical protein